MMSQTTEQSLCKVKPIKSISMRLAFAIGKSARSAFIYSCDSASQIPIAPIPAIQSCRNMSLRVILTRLRPIFMRFVHELSGRVACNFGFRFAKKEEEYFCAPLSDS